MTRTTLHRDSRGRSSLEWSREDLDRRGPFPFFLDFLRGSRPEKRSLRRHYANMSHYLSGGLSAKYSNENPLEEEERAVARETIHTRSSEDSDMAEDASTHPRKRLQAILGIAAAATKMRRPMGLTHHLTITTDHKGRPSSLGRVVNEK